MQLLVVELKLRCYLNDRVQLCYVMTLRTRKIFSNGKEAEYPVEFAHMSPP
jgi:hypothetical protein